MLQKSIDGTPWHDVLAGMLTDPRFRQFKKFCWHGAVDGTRVGVAVANRNPLYTTYALNKGHVDGLLAAKRSGKIDRAFIVAVANGAYIAYHDAEKYHADLLVNLQTRSGQFGEFWSLTHHEITGEEEPF
jgi:hypothetical protein